MRHPHQAGGLSAISRWLSEATPPVTIKQADASRQGCQHHPNDQINGINLSYITNQEEHHSKLSFRDELVTFLEKASVRYDPKYLD